jgi:hypothetical protein
MLDLDELEKVARAATPGPWAWENLGSKGGNCWIVGCAYDNDGQPLSGQIFSEVYDEAADKFIEVVGHHVEVIMSEEGEMGARADTDDARFIAKFDPPTVLEMIAELRALRAKLSDTTPAKP